MVLMATDLPEPVVPAIRRCGMRARSTITGSPPMVLPRQSGELGAAAGIFLGRQKFAQIDLLADLGLGSSMPITLRPETTATRAERAHIERAISSARPITRDDLMPGAGSSS